MKLVVLAVAAFVVILVIDRLFRSRGSAPVARRGLSSGDPGALQASDAEIERLVGLGRKIEAIKLHRELHGGGLKEAKDAIEALASQLER